MIKRGISAGRRVGIVFLILLALFHTVAHVFFYGTGVNGLVQTGVSGFSVGDLNLADDAKLEAQKFSPLSKGVIIAEWVLLIGLVVFTMFRTKVHASVPEPAHIESFRGPSKTDLDVLYDLLKQNKKLSLSYIQKTFHVDKDIVESWCRILESGNLAEVHYPHIGEPELRLGGTG